ncbi:hypothetical protein ACQR1W_39635 [Bradyrhizobium sp. HKCCYLS1011]|uniref:hypothetical protein n=1 Tax=Bradyrhizobium sp. HKCCYLS1011 TaxID=3420733 RepID=UPI003EBA9D9A
MRFFDPFVLMAAIALLSPVSAARADAKVTGMVTIDGACKKLTVGGESRTTDCKGILLNTEYSDQRTGFYFTTIDGLIVTFSTRGDQEVRADANTITAPVDMMIVSRKGQIDRIKAAGTCRFGDPFRGPTVIECVADSEGGRYEGTFLSNGQKPDLKTF